MTPDIERFLDLATRPLDASPAERDEAKGELMARVGHTGVPFDMLDLSAPLEQLEKAPPPRPWPRRIALLSALAVSIGAVLTGAAILTYEITLMTTATGISFRRSYHVAAADENPLLLDYVRRNAPELPLGREVLSGRGGAEEPALWLSRHPDDLAMLQEHVSRQIRRPGADWKDFDDSTKEKIARLDADNALWPLMQAATLIDSSCGRSARFGRASKATPVNDEAEFQNALRIFSEAATMSRYADRSLSLVRRQIDAFPPTRSISDELTIQAISGMVSPPFDTLMRFNHLGFSTMAEIHCARLVTAKDEDGLRKFHGDWEKLVRLVRQSPEPTERNGLEIVRELRKTGNVLSSSFDDLGMAAEKARTEESLNQLPDDSYSYHPLPPELGKVAGMRLMDSSSAADGLTVEEVLPSRKTELAFFDRNVAISLALLALIFSGLVGLEACRRSKIVKGTAKGLMPLFQREDHWWIGGLGLAVPWLWWWIITRLTPLGLRGENLLDLEVGMLAFLLQPLTALVFGMVMLLQTARWRWAARGGFLGLGGFLPWLGWAAAALTGLAMPAAGLVGFLDLRGEDKAIYLLGISCMAAFGLLWLLWEGIMILFTPRSSALRPNLVMRVLLPWTFAGILSLVAAFTVSTFMERIWFANDPLLPSWTSKTHRNALEERRVEAWRDSMRGQ